ncbi:MAG: aminodeoxychorismate synthase component I [Thiohalobacterales bacterium]|nr:aminodeoxychorismate synthase component I [Thiohalobacterales bacterium]
MAALSRTVTGVSDLLDLQRQDPQRYPQLLQSVAHGRYDILFAIPGDSLVLQSDGLLRGPDATITSAGYFLDALDRWWQHDRAGDMSDDLPFGGGWFVYLGYELAAQIEPTLRFTHADPWLPVAFATRFRTAVIRDRERDGVFIVGEQDTEAELAMIEADIAALPHAGTPVRREIRVLAISEDPDEMYLDAVRRIKRYIIEGDVFQVNLSRAWEIQLSHDADAAALYASLGYHNPAPFSGLVHWQDTSIISSSPERLVRVRGDRVETRPIAGTRPRSRSQTRDTAYSDELLSHPKERAEHIMLIDLERNDLGRLCIPGSIEVNEFMVLESYAHVHHIVSNIRGRLREGTTPGAVLRAVFPGGTITGCPKVRCMEIIAELEQTARGAYTGSMGYLNRDGSMDMNILIRTMISRGDRLALRAGAGIVADSEPHAELAETRAKARGLLRSLGPGTA